MALSELMRLRRPQETGFLRSRQSVRVLLFVLGGQAREIEGEIMTKDPVCGMDVDERDAREKGFTAEFGGQVRFFCSEECRDRFTAEPTRHWQAQQADVQQWLQKHQRHHRT